MMDEILAAQLDELSKKEHSAKNPNIPPYLDKAIIFYDFAKEKGTDLHPELKKIYDVLDSDQVFKNAYKDHSTENLNKLGLSTNDNVLRSDISKPLEQLANLKIQWYEFEEHKSSIKLTQYNKSAFELNQISDLLEYSITMEYGSEPFTLSDETLKKYSKEFILSRTIDFEYNREKETSDMTQKELDSLQNTLQTLGAQISIDNVSKDGIIKPGNHTVTVKRQENKIDEYQVPFKDNVKLKFPSK